MKDNKKDNKNTQVEEAFEIIKQKIISYELEPGTSISVNSLAQELNMSRTPVREAILLLQSYGLVSVNGTIHVTKLELSDIVEICQVREAVETQAVRIIIENGGLNEEQLKEFCMVIKKEVLCNLDHCYAVSVIGVEENIFFASEAVGSCIGFDSNGENPFILWDYPGGTMGMVEIPESGGDFLAVQNFLPVFQSEKASLVWVHRNEDESFSVHPFVDIPYVHRFDLLRQGNITYLIACTLCTSKQFTEDWSDPGKVYVGIMPRCPQDGIKLDIILEGLTHNHGYCSGLLDGRMTSLVGCDEGVFSIRPPHSCEETWEIEKLLQNPVGDIAMVDINGDGATELATIEPFHGSDLVIYQKEADGYIPIYRHHEKFEFGHTIWGGELLGAPAILCGCRAGKMELFCLRKILGGYRKELIDQGGGPSNIAVLHRKDAEIICTANRQAGQAVLYLLTPKDEEEVICQNI